MSRASSRSLSTTSYAVLGLLAVRTWTPYELARQMGASFSRFWPRAESKLYEEPKKLVEYGLATATAESAGKRPRTRYQITAAGREELRHWLTRRSRMPVLEAEPLLRVFFLEHGRNADVRSVLQDVAAWAASKIIADADTAQAYLDGAGGFPRRIAEVTLVGRFLSDFALMTYRWSRWAMETVDRWPDDTERCLEDREVLAEIAARAALVADADCARSE